MSALLKSIETVSSLALQSKDQPAKENIVSADYSYLLKSLEIVSDAYSRRPIILPREEKRSFSHLIDSIAEVSLTTSKNHIAINLPLRSSSNLLSFLNKDENENFHSDFIASFLDSRKSGFIARYFFCELIRFVTGERVSLPSIVSSRREISLGELLPGVREDISARRIDILAHSDEYLIVIENKVNSCESESQTSDYHEVVNSFNENLIRPKKVVEIFLSPGGEDPDCKSFHPMNYRDVFMILSSIHQNQKESQGTSYLNLYLESLFDNYFKTDSDYQNYIENFWRSYERRR